MGHTRFALPCRCLATVLAHALAVPLADASGAQNVGIVKTRLKETVQHNVPLPVLADNVSRQVLLWREKDAELFARVQSLKTDSDFRNPTHSRQYVERIRRQLVAQSTSELMKAGVPEPIAERIAIRTPRPYLVRLERALLSLSSLSAAPQPNSVQQSIQGAARGAMQPLLKPMVDQGQLRRVRDEVTRIKAQQSTAIENARSQIVFVAASAPDPVAVATASLTPLIAAASPSLESAVLDCLNDEAKKAFSRLTTEQDRVSALKTMALQLSQAPDVQSLQRKTAGMAQMGVEQGLKVTQLLGELDTVQRDGIAGLLKAGNDLQGGLAAARAAFESDLKAKYLDVASATRSREALPRSAFAAAGAFQDFQKFQATVFSFGNRDTALASLAALPAGLTLPGPAGDAVRALQQVTDTKASFATKTDAILGSLVNLTGSQQLKDIHRSFSQVSSVMNSLGPLTSLAAIGSGAGVFSLAAGMFGGGGLFGGDDGNAQALAEINRQLAEINGKLTKVLEKLDALDRTVRAQHVEVMNALEAISFDVSRIHEYVKDSDVMDFSSACEAIEGLLSRSVDPATGSADPLNVKSAAQKYPNCFEKLDVLTQTHTPRPALLAINHLKTDDLKHSAREKLLRIIQVFDKSHAEDACLSLTLGASYIEDLSAPKPDMQLTQDQEAFCQSVFGLDNILDSGMLQKFFALDAHATSLTTRLGATAQARAWTDDVRDAALLRWRSELWYLNVAIAQQAVLTGDVTALRWAGRLPELAADEAGVLDENEILLENALRVWVSQRLKTEEDVAAYSFAYAACDPFYLREAIGVPKESTAFLWLDVMDGSDQACPTAQSRTALTAWRWCIQIPGLKSCVKLPSPEEIRPFRLRLAGTLGGLIAARQQVLSLLDSSALVSKLYGSPTEDDELNLLEALAIQALVEAEQAARLSATGGSV